MAEQGIAGEPGLPGLETAVARKTKKYSDLIHWEPPAELTTVYIYEAPFELRDHYILETLAEYGDIMGGITRHKFKDYDIYNGVRSVIFYGQPRNIPGTVYVHGNRVKVRYDSQDRTPVCSICKTKGHYKTDCGKDKGGENVNEKEMNERENEESYKIPGREEDVRDKENTDRGNEDDVRNAEEGRDKDENKNGDGKLDKRQLSEKDKEQFEETSDRDDEMKTEDDDIVSAMNVLFRGGND